MLVLVLALVLVLVFVPALASACAHGKSASPVEAGALPDASPSADASASVDASPDAGLCGCAAQTCCAERDPGTGALVTRCLPNCITNTPRWKVCGADSECESGSCRSYDCGPGAPPLKYCDRPDGCQ